jgi:hypothetical protein
VIWDESLGPDSPSGDKKLQAEFAVNKNVGAYVRLTEPPANGSKVIVQKKVGQAWVSQGQSLVDSQSDQAKFVRAKAASLPGKGAINIAGSGVTILTTEDGSEIADENGSPLEWK